MIFRPARPSDLDEICALLATARRGPEYFHALLAADPGFDPAQIRLAWTRGHIVACARIFPRTLRIGPVATPVGGIGHLRTEPRQQGKGLASALLGECLTIMYHEGQTLAPLFARRHTLFVRRGWQAIAEERVEIPAKELAALVRASALGVRVRPFEGRDLDAVMALSDAANAARTCTIVRERDDWLARLTELDLNGADSFVAERDGTIVGYASAQPHGGTVALLELLLAPGKARPDGKGTVWAPLLHAALSRHGSATALRAQLPADYRRLIGTALEPHVSFSAGDDLMLRLVDPLRLLHALAPVLASRLREAERVAPLALRIGPLHGGAALRVEGREVDVSYPHRDDAYILPDEVFLPLLLGAEDADERLEAMPLPEPIRATLRRLFPPQNWVFWRSDAF